MVITRVGPLSFGKVLGIMYVGAGLVLGAIFSLFALAGLAFAPDADQGVLNVVLGVGSIIVLPIVYGCMGFVGGVVGALFYNVVAGLVGGVELDVESGSEPARFTR